MRTIAERNAEFGSMTPAQKRTAVARDVLARLDAREIAAIRGFYAEGVSTVEDWWGESLEDPADRGAECVVCAIGAAAVCVFDGEVIGRRGYEMVQRLETAGVFDRHVLRVMERVFEGGPVLPHDLGLEWAADMTGHGEVAYFPDEPAADVMRRIYRNVIEHGGEFVIRPLAEEAYAQWRATRPAGDLAR